MKIDKLIDAVCSAEFIKATLAQKIENVYSPEITQIQALILLSIKKNPNISMGEIQKIFGTTQQTNAKHFANLKKSDLVAVFKDSLDTRINRFKLEPAAIDILEKREKLLEREAEKLLDLDDIMKGLKKIESLLNKRLEKQKKKNK